MTSKIKKRGFSTADFGSPSKPKPVKVDDEKVVKVCMKEGGDWLEPIDKMRVKDIISGKISRSPQGSLCWYVNVFKHIRNPFFCHAFKTESGKRYDAVNDAGIFV